MSRAELNIFYIYFVLKSSNLKVSLKKTNNLRGNTMLLINVTNINVCFFLSKINLKLLPLTIYFELLFYMLKSFNGKNKCTSYY